MKFSSIAPLLLAVVLPQGLSSAHAQQENTAPKQAKIPESLIGDEHLREEFGVNEFTTPSIRRIFDQLDSLGTLPYDKLKRPIVEKAPSDRVVLSLGLGMLIGDGFLIVQCEKIEEMEKLGRALLRYAKALGAGVRINKHSQSLLENSVLGDWKKLREELAKTQVDVEAEMVLLRDVEVAHLIALGGWLRAFEISTEAVAANYSEEKSRNLGRADIVEYFILTLDGLHPKLRQRPYIEDIHEGLQALLPLLDVPEGKAFTESEVNDLREKAHLLAKVVTNHLPK